MHSYHLTGHAGVENVLSETRKRFWIIKRRSLSLSFVLFNDAWSHKRHSASNTSYTCIKLFITSITISYYILSSLSLACSQVLLLISPGRKFSNYQKKVCLVDLQFDCICYIRCISRESKVCYE